MRRIFPPSDRSPIRPQYRERRDCLLAALHRYFGLVEVSGEDGGLHIFWQLPPDFPDATTVETLARRVRVGVYALANAGTHDARDTILSRRGLVLGYAALTPNQIEEGIARLDAVLEEAIPRRTIGPRLPSAHPGVAMARARRAPENLVPHNRQPPALRGTPQPRAMSRRHSSPQSGTDMPVVTSIYRYPIKGARSPCRAPFSTPDGRFRRTGCSRWRDPIRRSIRKRRNGPRRACS